MFDPNVPKVLERIGPDDVVLDIGGWARCFNRANYVMDGGFHETRGQWYLEQYGIGPQGGDVEHFDASGWIRRDICAREPFPFANKSIDFCVCSHTLEDIRDPVWVCSEINRVAKRGYIEIPSAVFELTRGWEPHVPVGLSHHRWIVEERHGELIFFPKHHYIHGDPRHSLSHEVGQSVPEERRVTWLFWDGELRGSEHSWSKEDAAEMVLRLWARETGETREEIGRRIEAHAEAGATDDVSDARFRRLEERLAEELGRVDELRARLASYADLGPTALDVTRRLRGISRRHPKLASLLRQVVRVA